ncbi:22666_t:CDS:2 [Cetraspora pellucida]|uniref:22666_t:CDS:1 n=1 Tax=Cetraspora pellucida TaxID=1433469 RepID=A0A9N9AA07_9GLOM|nr:22666_t:CDS:2 [Cetraspora pellucida]
MTVNNTVLYFIRTGDGIAWYIIKIDDTNYLIDGGPSTFPSYQYFKSVLSEHKLSHFKKIIITNPRKKHLGGIQRLLKEEYLSPNGIHALNIDHVIMTEEFRNKKIIDILTNIGFGLDNKEPKVVHPDTIMEFFFHKSGKQLILKHKEQDVDSSSILTYVQYDNDKTKKSVFLTSDNVASWIQEVLTTKLNLYQPMQPNERPYIDIFQVPRHGSKINSIITETYVHPPKYVHQQFALMIILYYSGQYGFNETNIDVNADFEMMLSFINFKAFNKAALLQGYNQTFSNRTAIKRFLKLMAKALTIRSSSKDHNVDWDWNEINWSEVLRKLYRIYKTNQNAEPRHWPKYDFIKDVIGEDITEELLNSYYKSIKERIFDNFDLVISTKNKIKHRPQYATHFRPLLSPMWHCLNISPLAFRYIVSSISNFYKSFIVRTYIISSGSKHGHPSPLVIIGIIKSILEDSRNARILLTGGSKINMNSLASTVDDLLKIEKDEFYNIYKLLNKHIKIYAINDNSFEVGINLFNDEFEDPKSVRLLSWNCSDSKEIKKISDSFKPIPEQPINKISEFYIKISINDEQLWLGVSKKGNLIPSYKPVSFFISNVPFLDQIAYRISSCNSNFIVRFEWATRNKYDDFYLIDLSTEQDLYYALDYDDDFYVVPLHFKKQLTSEENSEHNTLSGLTIINALNYIIRACNVKKVFKSFLNECLLLQADLDSELEWRFTQNNLIDIKSAIIRLKKSELQKFCSFSPFFKHATAMQVNIENAHLDNLQLEIKIFLDNGSKSNWVWTPEISDISITKSVYDYLLNANVSQKKWKDITFSYLSLLIMPPLMVTPEFLKVPLPFLSGTTLLDLKVNKEISDINFEIGPTGARLIQIELFLDLDISIKENIFYLDGIQISQLNNIKATIINSDAVNGDPNITIEAHANIKDNSIKILTKNENEQVLKVNFNDDTTFDKIALALNVSENIYNKLRVPLFNTLLNEFLKDIKPEFGLLFYPITEPPTMNFYLKNISIFSNKFPEMKKFIPSQIYQNLRLTNVSIDISIYNPLYIENTIGLDIKFNLLTTDDKKLAGNLSYIPVKNTEQPILVSIKPQDLDDNNPLNVKEMLKTIGLYDTFEKLNEVSPILWFHVKNLESVNFQYLELQIKLNEQNAIYEIGDFTFGISIPKFIIKEGVIEVINAIIDLGYNGTLWSGSIHGIAEIIGKDTKYSCQIEYMPPTKEQHGRLLIKNIDESLNLKEIIQILQLENISIIPVLGKLFETMNISKININQVNSDYSDFIIQDLSFILQSNKLILGPLTIEQSEVCISYFPPKNDKDSAIWKFSIEGYIDRMIASLIYNNENRKIQATLVPVKSKKLKEIKFIKAPKFSDNSMYSQVCDSEITNVELIINIHMDSVYVETFKTKLGKVLSYDGFILDNLTFKYEEVKYMLIDNHSPNNVAPPHRKHILKAIISRKEDISAEIEIDCSENVVEASITSFSDSSLLGILKFLIGYKQTLPDLLPKLPNLPIFDNIKLDQKFFVKISIKPFKIIAFNISVENEIDRYEIPLITLQPFGVSINYEYDLDRKKEKLEGIFYGTFLLLDMSELRLKFARSNTEDENIVVASIESIKNEGSIYISGVVDTLLNDVNEDKGWSTHTPKEMRSPKFIVKSQNSSQPVTLSDMILATEEQAYLHINLAETSVALYASIKSIGNALLLVKKLNTKTSINNEFGYLFSLKIPNDFQFKDLFKSTNIVYNIDEMLPLKQANLVLASYESITFENAKKELNKIIKDLNDNLNLDDENSKDKKQIEFEDIIPITLPDRKDIYEPILVQGVNLYAILDYTKEHSFLLKNPCATTDLVSKSPKILIQLSLRTDASLSESEFKATIEDLTLYCGISFEKISFSYKPENNDSNKSELIISGDLNFDKLLGTKGVNIKGKLIIKKGSSSFEVNSELLKSQVIEHPFGMSGICIKELDFGMNFEYDPDFVIIEANKAFNRKLQNRTHLIGKVSFRSEKLNMETILKGRILFVNGTPTPCVCSISIENPIEITHLLATILSVEWPTDFPNIIFTDGEIYYMAENFPEDRIIIDGNVYYKGYKIRALIDFFGMVNISITAQVKKGMIIIKAENINSEINLGFIKITKYNLTIESHKHLTSKTLELSKSNHSIDINGFLELFNMKTAEFKLNYKNKTRCLEGEINIKGSLLGIDNPTIRGYWSQKNKFVITEWPSLCQMFWEAAKFANIIEKASVGLVGLCEVISDLNFEEGFDCHFDINLKQLEPQSDTLVTFSVTGKYLIRIIGGREKSTEILEIDIPSSIQFDIIYPIHDKDIPSRLLKDFKEQLPKSAVKFVQNLLKDPEKFVKFLNGLSIATLIKLSESSLKGFVCLIDDEINKLSKATSDAMKKCAKNILETKQPKHSPKKIEGGIKAVEEAQTLSSAIELASPLLLMTGGWLGYFSVAIELITIDLKNLYGNQSNEEKEIRKNKSEMVELDKRIKNAVERFLKMDYLTPELEFCSDNTLKIKWNIPINAANDKLADKIRYKLDFIIFGKEIIKTYIIIGKKEIESDKSDNKILSYVLSNELLMKCNKCSVKITALLQYDKDYYSGSQSKEGEIEHKPKLYPPTRIKFAYNAHDKILTTEIISEDKDIQQYYCELINHNDDNNDDINVVYHETININTLESTLLIINAEEKLIFCSGGRYKIRCSTKSTNWKDSEFKYSDEVIPRLPSPISVEFKRFYDTKKDAEYLKIHVKDITDQQLRGYTYDVINDNGVIYSLPNEEVSMNPPNLKLDELRRITKQPIIEHYIRIKKIAKEESNWMDSGYTLSSKSFKFLSQVNNIKGSYNINNNVLEIMWDPVENASQYEVFLLAFGQRLSFNKIPETFIEYDMQEFEKQIMNSGCPIITYTCTIQAVNGKGSFDGPVAHINKGFKQLPKPTNVNMEKISNKLHITYTPITLSDNLKKDFKGYRINLCNIQSPNERLVAKSPLIEDINSGCHDFHFEDIKFEEVKHELSLAEIREIHDSPEIAEFHAFAQSIGDKDEFDSIIANSNSVVTQFKAPENILLELEKQEFSVTYFAPTEGFYEAQIIDNNDHNNIFGGAKKKASNGNDEIIIQGLNLKKDIEYIARLRKVVHDENPAENLPSIWQFSNLIKI